MIQRIQTLFLLLASISLGVLLFIPLGHLITPNEILVDFQYNGIPAGDLIENSYNVLPLTILMYVTTALCFLSIILYKRRTLQIRLCGINIFLIVGQIGLFLFYFFNAAKQLDARKDFNISIVLPVVAIILLFLAIRHIAKDQALVLSADRIR
jgi:glucan phosphoethanolaminetransferase (alkaline phosphatase superfamily)